MLTESEVRSRVREALEVVTPPAPWLARNIQQSVDVRMRKGFARRTPRALRVSLRVLAAAALVILVVAGVATFLIARYSPPRPVPAGPSLPAHSPGWLYGGVAMVNPTYGWQYGLPFTHTADGGVTWTDVTPKGVGQSIDEYYLDASHAWVLDFSVPGHFTTYRTADGGRTWEHGSPTAISSELGGQPYFVDLEHGWLLMSNGDYTTGTSTYSDTLYRTDDGGLHWAEVAVDTAPPTWKPGSKDYCYEWCGSIAFASPTTGWLSAVVLTKPVLLVTHNGGVTWTQTTLSLTGATRGCPCTAGQFLVFGELHLVVELFSRASGRITLAVTSDGGATWTLRALPGGDQVRVGFFDSNHGWLIDQTALSTTSFTSPTQPLHLYITADGGLTWTRVQTNLELQSKDGQIISLYFIDQRDGFAIRTNGPAGCGPSTPGCTPVWSLLRTTDGGHTWSLVNASV